jgi:phosphoserine phosphatase
MTTTTVRLASPVDPSVAGNPGARCAAFFDLDRTLVTGSSMFEVAKELRMRGVLRARNLAPLSVRHFVYRWRGTERVRDVESARTLALELVRGKSADELRKIAADVVDRRITPNLNPAVVARVGWHQARGDDTYIVTAAAYEVAQILSERLHMTGALGTHDLLLLELVGNPWAVNPGRRLRAIALARDWPILDARRSEVAMRS